MRWYRRIWYFALASDLFAALSPNFPVLATPMAWLFLKGLDLQVYTTIPVQSVSTSTIKLDEKLVTSNSIRKDEIC
ncbi:hypothetical protein BXZ70DRAFT_56949 [Cristinia sonorae]|uniref:Uncharacterized protein n=1 Tax=Cristinia sonorae TaxID=1940300 RepID=A0A8K0XRE8_9AGAR|nr:hypothetical protein BXZ70DRAFT_56949 [Cristinia sonorae]